MSRRTIACAGGGARAPATRPGSSPATGKRAACVSNGGRGRATIWGVFEALGSPSAGSSRCARKRAGEREHSQTLGLWTKGFERGSGALQVGRDLHLRGHTEGRQRACARRLLGLTRFERRDASANQALGHPARQTGWDVSGCEQQARWWWWWSGGIERRRTWRSPPSCAGKGARCEPRRVVGHYGWV